MRQQETELQEKAEKASDKGILYGGIAGGVVFLLIAVFANGVLGALVGVLVFAIVGVVVFRASVEEAKRDVFGGARFADKRDDAEKGGLK